MDVNKLLKALDDDSNEQLLNFTSKKILEMNLKIVNELQLERKEALDLMQKLKGYRYIDELDDLKYGTYIRWIPLDDPKNIYITKGSLFCEYKIKDDGVYLICKNFHIGWLEIMVFLTILLKVHSLFGLSATVI
jgi:hypothetical protein